MANQRCRACNATGKRATLGHVEHECIDCKGAGYVVEQYEPTPTDITRADEELKERIERRKRHAGKAQTHTQRLPKANTAKALDA